jgi:hypothetical protein
MPPRRIAGSVSGTKRYAVLAVSGTDRFSGVQRHKAKHTTVNFGDEECRQRPVPFLGFPAHFAHLRGPKKLNKYGKYSGEGSPITNASPQAHGPANTPPPVDLHSFTDKKNTE